MAERPLWWEARRAQSTKPATYKCPFCGKQLPAMSEHMLLFPEGDHQRRRHAHSVCVMQMRKAGKLPTKAEWQATQPKPPRRRWLPWRRSG
ncbi:MAG: hypothetical protein J2O48_07860 [Solirubrobacterales bacterium]|nr:hypothetical protein [Solirubrobacterales bacterium]